MTTLTRSTIIDIDTQLAEIWRQQNRAADRIAQAEDGIRYTAGQKRDYRTHAWSGSLVEAQSTVEALAAVTENVTYRTHEAQRALDAVEEAETLYRLARAAAEPLEAIYAEYRWSRFFIVNNTNGHVHSSMHCTTCFVTTAFGWLPELSGGTEEDMVEQFGETACTVCFPSAPTMKGFEDGTSAFAQLIQAGKDERAQAKAERDAKKAAKTLDTPVVIHGSVFAQYSRTDTVRTVAAAKSAIKGFIDDSTNPWSDQPIATERIAEDTAKLVEALAAKGIDVTDSIAKWTKAAAKR
jgi:hypothetical protein